MDKKNILTINVDGLGSRDKEKIWSVCSGVKEAEDFPRTTSKARQKKNVRIVSRRHRPQAPRRYFDHIVCESSWFAGFCIIVEVLKGERATWGSYLTVELYDA